MMGFSLLVNYFKILTKLVIGLDVQVVRKTTYIFASWTCCLIADLKTSIRSKHQNSKPAVLILKLITISKFFFPTKANIAHLLIWTIDTLIQPQTPENYYAYM